MSLRADQVPRRIEPLRPVPRPAVRAWAERHGFSPELVARWVAYLPEPQRLLASLLEPVPRYVRVNTLHPQAATVLDELRERGFVLDEVETPDPRFVVVRIVKEPYAISATPEYLAGALYLQDLASLSAAAALAPEPGDVVLDMAAAPGGKTAALAELAGDDLSILAVEPVPKRAAALTTNLRRLGVRSVGVAVMGAESVPGVDVFDKILLDAPCTGEGVLPRDVKRRRGVLEEHAHLAGLQRRLLSHAIRLLKPGGTLVYSTCTFSPEECEEVVRDAVGLGLVTEALPFDRLNGASLGAPLWKAGDREFGSVVQEARRIYPHVHRTLGFFLVRLRKPMDWRLPDDAPWSVPAAAEPGQIVRVGRGAVNAWDDDDIAVDLPVPGGAAVSHRGGSAGRKERRAQGSARPANSTKTRASRRQRDDEIEVETTGLDVPGSPMGRDPSSSAGSEGDESDAPGAAASIGFPQSDTMGAYPAEIRDLHPPEQEALEALFATYGEAVSERLVDGRLVLKVLGRPDLTPQRRVILVERQRVADLAPFAPCTLGIPVATLTRHGAKLTLEGGAVVARVASVGKAGVREKGEQLFLYGRDVLGRSLAWVDKGTAKGSTVLVLDGRTRRYLGLAILDQERRFLDHPKAKDERFLKHVTDLGRYLRAQQEVPE